MTDWYGLGWWLREMGLAAEAQLDALDALDADAMKRANDRLESASRLITPTLTVPALIALALHAERQHRECVICMLHDDRTTAPVDPDALIVALNTQASRFGWMPYRTQAEANRVSVAYTDDAPQ